MLLAAGRLLPLAAVCYWLLKPSPRQPAKQPPPGVDWRARSGLHATVKEKAPATGKSYLVIGTGSVGLIIMEALVERGEKKVKGLDVVAPRRGVEGATFAVGNVTDYSSIKAACEGVDVVYLTVALIRYYERLQYQYAASHAVNVTGTGNVLRACAECGVQVLVQTSTSNVCVAPALVSTSMDESSELVGPQNSPNHYGWTKAQAETMVLAANGAPLEPAARGALQTVAVRPCSGIFGLQDNFMTEKWLELGQVQIIPISPHISPYLPISPHISPYLVSQVQIMLPEPLIDYVYNENVAYAHLLAEAALHAERAKPPPQRRVGGEAFCITNGEPLRAADFHDAVGHYYERQTGGAFKQTYLPRRLMMALGYAVELVQRATRGRVTGDLALLTPAMFAVASLTYAFSSAKAKERLGYEPLYTLHEALQRTVYLWHTHRAGVAGAKK